ncbi:MAG: mechanosensitive ion channel domain-containing protein [Pseudomonadota bacterium]
MTVASPPAPVDPVDAITETAETASEAAGSLLSWITSGSREGLIALGLTIAAIVALYTLRWALYRAVARLPRKDEVSVTAILDRMLHRFRSYFILAIALSITNWFMDLPDAAASFITVFLVLTAVLQTAEWVQEAAISTVRRNVRRSNSDASTLASAVNVIKWFVSAAVWSIAALLILDNIGADVTTLIAGLGIGGIAIGLAAQGMFRDLFSSLSIIFDKPFQVGDTIRYGETWGTVEDIGLKTTRIRERHGEQVIISNTQLLEFEIHNMKRMARRRIETGFGVIYQTPPDVAERIPGMVAELVKGIQGADFDRCTLNSYGPSSLDYELVFYALNPDFNRSKALRSKVLLAIFRMFKDEGVEFAYPTQTLFIEGAGEEMVESTVQTLKTVGGGDT